MMKRTLTMTHRALAVLLVITAAAAAAIILQSGAGSLLAEASAAPTTVVRYRTLNGDSKSVLRNVSVVVRDQNGATVAHGTSGSDGMVTVTVDGIVVSQLTAVATAPKKHVTFPVTTPLSGAAGRIIDVPLYRTDQQWLGWGRSDDRRRVGPATGKPGRLLWKIDPGNNMEFPPTLAYGVVVYGSYHGFLVANDQTTRKELWRAYPGTAARPSKFASQVAVSTWIENGVRVARVFYTDLAGLVGCRDLFTGRLVWEKRSGRGSGTSGKTIQFKSFEASPLVRGESVYVCTRYDKRNGSRAGLWALDRRTGDVRWFMRLATSSKTKIGASPAYSGGRIYVATYDGYVYALRATDSAARRKRYWRRYLGGELYSTPAVTSSRLYVGSKSNGRMYCLNRNNGRLLWRTARLGTSVHGSPAVYGGRVFIGAGKRFYALRAGNGSVVWRRATKKRVWGSASVLRGVVYYSCYGATYARTAGRGNLVWRKNVGRYSPVTATRHLIIVTGRRTFAAYKPVN